MMSNKHATLLGDEMERCMRELNTLRAEGLEAELLGRKYRQRSRSGDRVNGSRVQPIDEDLDDDPDKSAFKVVGKSILKPGVNDTGARGRPYDSGSNRAAENQGGPRGRSRPAADDYGSRSRPDPSSDDIDPDDDDDDNDDTNEERPIIWDAVGKFFNIENIRDEQHVRQVILDALQAGVFVGEMDPKVREIFFQLTDHVLEEALQVAVWLKKTPGPKDMEKFGLAMIIVTEYLKLSGLREHIRQDMRTFVDIYELTATRSKKSTRADQGRFMLFYEYRAELMKQGHSDHSKGVAMTLFNMGIEIMRKMLIAGTHLVEVIAALKLIQ